MKHPPLVSKSDAFAGRFRPPGGIWTHLYSDTHKSLPPPPQVREHKEGEKLRRVFLQSTVANLGLTKLRLITRTGCSTLARILALSCSIFSSVAPSGLCLSSTRRLTGRIAISQLASIDIGEILGMSHRTVNKHLEHIFEKLGVETRSAAAALATGHFFEN